MSARPGAARAALRAQADPARAGSDPHDRMHEAMGWMLREVGERVDEDALRGFLEKHAPAMPRPALRDAIERFAPVERRRRLAVRRSEQA